MVTFIRAAVVALLVAWSLCPAPVQAQAPTPVIIYCGTPPVPCSSSSPVTVTAQPYSFTPLTPDQHNLAITTSTALTIPAGALFASVCAKGNSVNYTFDGTTTPTVSIGNPLAQGQCIFLSGPLVLANFLAIQQAATATLDVAYTK